MHSYSQPVEDRKNGGSSKRGTNGRSGLKEINEHIQHGTDLPRNGENYTNSHSQPSDLMIFSATKCRKYSPAPLRQKIPVLGQALDRFGAGVKPAAVGMQVS